MARDYLLNFGSLTLSGASTLAAPTITATTGYSTGTTNLLLNAGSAVVDLGVIGGQNNRSELFVKINVNATAVTGGGTGDYWTIVPLVEASKDGTNFSVVSTLPVDVTALRVAYATATTISGDSSSQVFVPMYAPAGTMSQNASGAADDNYRYFRVRIMTRVLGTGANNAPAGSSWTITATVSGAIVNSKDGAI
jgi:hypothetical protein